MIAGRVGSEPPGCVVILVEGQRSLRVPRAVHVSAAVLVGPRLLPGEGVLEVQGRDVVQPLAGAVTLDILTPGIVDVRGPSQQLVHPCQLYDAHEVRGRLVDARLDGFLPAVVCAGDHGVHHLLHLSREGLIHP